MIMSFLSLPSCLIVSLALHLRSAAASGQAPYKDNSASCGCYYVDSDSNPTYFTNHRFYDFRNVATSPKQYTVQPPLVNNTQSAGNEQTPDQDYLNSTTWNNDWGIQNWGKKATEEFPVMMQNSPANVYITQTNSSDLSTSNSSSTTYLTLRTTRLDDFQSAAEIENENKNLMYASLRMRARVVGASGAVAGFFTFYDDTNESDIEILTADNTSTWRFTNQPSVDKNGDEDPRASQEKTRLGAWDEWREHRIDWVKGVTRWYVDGEYITQNTYSVPRKPSGLVLNMWSDGGTWSGNMSVGDSAELQIQWVQMVFNTSGKREGPPGGDRGSNKKRDLEFEELEERHWWEKRKSNRCKTVCKVDDVEMPGYPEVTYVAAAHHEAVSRTAWLVVALAGVFSALVAI